jgi:hypothetical protein
MTCVAFIYATSRKECPEGNVTVTEPAVHSASRSHHDLEHSSVREQTAIRDRVSDLQQRSGHLWYASEEHEKRTVELHHTI